MNKDAWFNWYPERKVEDGVRDFADALKAAGLTEVLDFGCGTGRNTVYMAGLGFQMHGFDWSEASIKEAAHAATKAGLDIDLRVWDMNESPLPYPDSYFDGILIVKVIHHTFEKNIRSIGKEIARITKKGGLLYLEAPAYERAHRPYPSTEPEPGTFVPSTGDEAGVPHHFFKKEELASVFSEFDILELSVRYDYHYCMKARRS